MLNTGKPAAPAGGLEAAIGHAASDIWSWHQDTVLASGMWESQVSRDGLEALLRRAILPAAAGPDGGSDVRHQVGDTVRLRPYDDLRAVVRAHYRAGREPVRYECGWFDGSGARHIELFLACELAEDPGRGREGAGRREPDGE